MTLARSYGFRYAIASRVPDQVCLTCQPPHLYEGEPVAPTPSAENRPPSHFGVLRGCYTYGALSNPAGLGGLLGLSRAGALAMCAKCRRAGAGVRTPPPGGPARECGCARLTRFAHNFHEFRLC